MDCERVVRAALATALLVAAPALADDPASVPAHGAATEDAGADAVVPEDVETLIITASQEPLSFSAIPGSVDVIDRAAIEASRMPTVLELLRRRPGLHIEQAGAAGSRASLFTRGLEANYTLVMIDGVAMNDPSNARGGSFDFSTLGVENIERIEIVRGPVSAVHGSDAIAGAVNIVTRGGRGPDAIGLDVEGGRWGYVRTSGGVRGERGPVDLALTSTFLDQGDPDDVGNSEGGTLLSSLGARLGEDTQLRGTLRYAGFDEEAFPDASGGPDYAVRRTREQREIDELNAGVTLDHGVNDWLDASLLVGAFHRTEERRSPGVAPIPGAPGTEVPAEPDSNEHTDRASARLRATARAPHGLSLTAGGDFYWERGLNEGTLVHSVFGPLPRAFDLTRVVGGPFTELHWESSFGFVALASVRVDFPDDPDPEVTPRVGASYRVPWIEVELFGSWGEGFKLPSLFALGHPLVGNAALVPERSRGWDLGVRRSFCNERIDLALTGFDNRVENLIDFDPNTNALVNLPRARSKGVEFELGLRPIDSLRVRSYATWVDARDLATGNRLRNRPEWRGGFGVEWEPIAGLRAGLDALFVGNVIDFSNPTGIVRLDSWTRLDLVVAWRARDWIELTFAIDNLLDADYEEVVGFPALGIRPRVGVRLRLP